MRTWFFCRLVAPMMTLILSCCAAFSQEPGTVRLPAKDKFHIFLLAGQSNMAGRGVVEEQDLRPHPRVLMLTKDQRWVPAVDPMHYDKPAVAGVGLGRSFGIRVAEADPAIIVGLVPCAAGGSPIASWAPGGYHDQTDSYPLDDALRRARFALRFGTMKGILWHQGESDAQNGRAEVYEGKLHALIALFRKEVDAPDLPFLAGQLGRFPDRPWDDPKRMIDAAHRSLPDEVAHTAFVGSEGLTHKGDGVHFDAASCREFGRRYAEAYLVMISRGDAP